MRKLLRCRRGETLVEVMCACCLLVLALGGLLGAVRFANNSFRRAETMEEHAARLRENLRTTEDTAPAGTADYTFTTYSPDGPCHGEEPLFTVTASLETKNAAYQAEDGEMTTVTYRLFACPEGGGSP